MQILNSLKAQYALKVNVQTQTNYLFFFSLSFKYGNRFLMLSYAGQQFKLFWSQKNK